MTRQAGPHGFDFTPGLAGSLQSAQAKPERDLHSVCHATVDKQRQWSELRTI
eukprot:COSAG06_NODE_4935_length_3849_cov_14.543200_6_plen_52_part_00